MLVRSWVILEDFLAIMICKTSTATKALAANAVNVFGANVSLNQLLLAQKVKF